MEFNEIYFHATVAVKVEGNKQYNVLFEKRSTQSIVDGVPWAHKNGQEKATRIFSMGISKGLICFIFHC